MNRAISRRSFVKSSLLATAAVPLATAITSSNLPAQPAAEPATAGTDPMPMGRIGGRDFSRIMLGGNLIGGYAHARELSYVGTLMRGYNTPAKIRETLEIAEAHGINVMNTWVLQDNQSLFDHWKNGGRMQWISQARLDEGGGFSQVQKAADQGAVGIHLTGDTCEQLLSSGKFEKVPESLQFIKERKLISGVAAHDLKVIEECEKLKLEPDFYQKTFHSLDYYTAPGPTETDFLGAHDNSWCNNPEAVIKVMGKVTRPWVAFKILAAGAIPPRAAFPYAFNNGADFILVGMFDWQVQEDAQLVKRIFRVIKSPKKPTVTG